MRWLPAATLMLALASAPSVAQAAMVSPASLAGTAALAASPGGRRVGSTPAGPAAGDTADYATREAAAPELGKFQGGSVVIFISGGVVLVVVIIVLIVVLA